MLKVAVIPAGSVGAYFGARLVQAGAEVRFLARGQHLRALQEQGLKVRSVAGDFRLEPGQYVASNDPAKILAEADLVFFAPKSKDTEGLARQIEPVLEEKTVVISLQNGVDNEPALAAILGADRVAQGAAYIESYLEGPGEVVHLRVGRIEVASTTLGGRTIPALDELKRLSERANFGFETTENGHNLKWSKLVLISAFSGWTTTTRRKIDGLLADAELKEAFRQTMLETATVAKADGATFEPEQTVNNVMAIAEKLGDMGSSMLFDLEHGNPLENEALNGAVLRKGRELGVPTPYNQALYALIRTYEKG